MEKKYVLHKENAILVVLIEKYIGSSGVWRASFWSLPNRRNVFADQKY
jgi:hypothetical protein